MSFFSVNYWLTETKRLTVWMAPPKTMAHCRAGDLRAARSAESCEATVGA